MARYSGGDGMTKVVFALAIASIGAPTVAELNAAVDWSTFVTKDGLKEPADQNNTPIAALAHTFNAQVPGSFGGVLELTIMRDNVTDVPWNAITYGQAGFVVIRSGTPVASAWGVGNKARVYPGIWHEPVPSSTSGDTPDQFTAAFPVGSQPNLKAVVA
jgi:hypothetical protein